MSSLQVCFLHIGLRGGAGVSCTRRGTKNDAYMKEARYGKQICSGAEAVSAHTHGRDLHGDAADGDPGAASQGDRRVGAGHVRPARGANEEERRRHGAAQGRRSDGMGQTDEFHSQPRGGIRLL